MGNVQGLTHKQLVAHWYVPSSVATDALVLKHQAIDIHNADYKFIVLDQFHTQIFQLQRTILENIILSWQNEHPFL